MPELPEVECVVRQLGRLVSGRTILSARLIRPGLAPDSTPRSFAASLRGARIEGVGRRGKHILIHLSNGRTLITHLRMTGRFVLLRQQAGDPPHTHAAFSLDRGEKLLFADQRHFGFMILARTAGLGEVPCLAELGPEPFGEEFSPAYLRGVLGRSRRPVKLLLLDQTRVVGLGNIYASEALHRAGIDPRKPAAKISTARAEALHREIVAVLSEAVANDATFDRETGDLDSSYGRYEAVARVYEREGLPCLACAAPIRRITQGARSTYFCPRCQK